jgi:hypothetical protein
MTFSIAPRPARPRLAPPRLASAPAAALRRAVLFCVLLLVALGCAHRNIPNTDVQDTSDNRKIINFCEQYRKAVERRNTALLLELAHPKYYEDGGNADSSDDIDRAGLEEFLKTKFSQAKAIRYEIRYRSINKGRQGEILVDYTYSASYKIPTKKGEVWRRSVADNRLELVADGESFRILSGM